MACSAVLQLQRFDELEDRLYEELLHTPEEGAKYVAALQAALQDELVYVWWKARAAPDFWEQWALAEPPKKRQSPHSAGRLRIRIRLSSPRLVRCSVSMACGYCSVQAALQGELTCLWGKHRQHPPTAAPYQQSWSCLG